MSSLQQQRESESAKIDSLKPQIDDLNRFSLSSPFAFCIKCNAISHFGTFALCRVRKEKVKALEEAEQVMADIRKVAREEEKQLMEEKDKYDSLLYCFHHLLLVTGMFS